MKVLLDNQVYENQNFGGIGRYFNELQRGNDTIEKMEPFLPAAPVKKSFFRKLEHRIRPQLTGNKQKGPDKYNFYKEQLRNRSFDIFHPTYYDNYFLEDLKQPFVLTVHDMIHEIYPELYGYNNDSLKKRILCEKASKIIAISNNTKRDLVEIFKIPETKIKVIYHSTSLDQVPAIEPDCSLGSEGYLLFTGNRTYYKNFLTFLIAVEPILKERNLKLICTGSAFSNVEKKWLEDLRLSKFVENYYCKVDGELVFLYQNAVCFIFPSLYEGFGFPLLEAFASNCPVVSSDKGSLKEIADKAAVYFDPKNIYEMRNAIIRVISDEFLQTELIKAGKDRLKDFSWKKCQIETNALYSEII